MIKSFLMTVFFVMLFSTSYKFSHAQDNCRQITIGNPNGETVQQYLCQSSDGVWRPKASIKQKQYQQRTEYFEYPIKDYSPLGGCYKNLPQKYPFSSNYPCEKFVEKLSQSRGVRAADRDQMEQCFRSNDVIIKSNRESIENFNVVKKFNTCDSSERIAQMINYLAKLNYISSYDITSNNYSKIFSAMQQIRLDHPSGKENLNSDFIATPNTVFVRYVLGFNDIKKRKCIKDMQSVIVNDDSCYETGSESYNTREWSGHCPPAQTGNSGCYNWTSKSRRTKTMTPECKARQNNVESQCAARFPEL